MSSRYDFLGATAAGSRMASTGPSNAAWNGCNTPRRSPRPVLIIADAAKPDEPIPARWFQAASPATVHVWVVPHAGHTQGLAAAPRAWATHVISFLNAALDPDPPGTAPIHS